VVFCVAIYFQGWRREVTIKPRQVSGTTRQHPIRLFYTSNTPIILQSALVSNFLFLSQLLNRALGNNLVTNLIGSWADAPGSSFTSSHSVPVGGIAYYISPISSFGDIGSDPLHAIIYLVFVLGFCGLFSRLWIMFGGGSAQDVYDQITGRKCEIVGFEGREAGAMRLLNSIIPMAATIGGIAIGLLSVSADFLGAIGSGTGILLAVGIIYGYYEQIAREVEDSGLGYSDYFTPFFHQ